MIVTYLCRRVAQGVLTIVGVTFGIFYGFSLIPFNGNGTAIFGQSSTPTQNARLLAEPLWRQYLHTVVGWLHGDLGYEPAYNSAILPLVRNAARITLVLCGSATVLALGVAVPLGIYQAWHSGTAVDRAVLAVNSVLASTPVMLTSFVLLKYLAIDNHVLPVVVPSLTGFGTIFRNYSVFVLPVVTLALAGTARITTLVSVITRRELRQGYMATASAKGLSTLGAVRRHLLRNVVTSLLDYGGLLLAFMFSASLVVESIFNLPGLGYYLWQAANPKHLYFPVEVGAVLATSIVIVTLYVLLDTLAVMLEPRRR